MPVPLPVMKVRCSQCKRIAILHFKSDVIMGMPRCRGCGVGMVVVGKPNLQDWIKYPLNKLRNL